MSALLRAAKINRVNRAHPGVYARYHRGDPGLLGDIWGGIKGAVGGFITGGPLGAVAGGVGALLAKKGGAPKQMALAGDPRILSPQINIGSGGNTMPGVGTMPPMFGPGNQTQSGPGAGLERDPWTPGSGGTPCQRGYHYNKSDYWTKKYGFIPKATVCVKNRKRNPLNPRAASRAMSRLASAKKATRFLSKFSIKSSGCGCK